MKATREPHDRLTRIADAMMTAALEHPEYTHGDKIIAAMDDGRLSGLGQDGYEDVAAALHRHMAAIMSGSGYRVVVTDS